MTTPRPATPPDGLGHRRKLSRHARRMAAAMLKVGRTPHHAAVVHAQVNALDYEVNRKDRGKRAALPAEPEVAEGRRVRLGSEVRAILRRLLATDNLRVQQALVRELRHAVLRRVRRAADWERRRLAARRNAARAWFWLTGQARRGAAWARVQAGHSAAAVRDRRQDRQQAASQAVTRVVGNRAVRPRAQAVARVSPALALLSTVTGRPRTARPQAGRSRATR